MRYQSELGLSAYDADVIVAAAGAYFDSAIAATPSPNPKKAANLLSKIGLRLQKTEPDLLSRRDGVELARVVALVDTGDLSSQNAEQVYEQHLRTGEGIDAIVASLGLRQISDDGPLRDAIGRVLDANTAAVADVAAGKTQALGFLTGQVMKETRGQANAGASPRCCAKRWRSGRGVILNIVLWAAGAVLLVLGILRVQAPLSRANELKRLDENARRYDAWRAVPGPQRRGPRTSAPAPTRCAPCCATRSASGRARSSPGSC